MTSCDLLVRNGYIVTMDQQRTIYANGAIAITGRQIVDVGRDADLAAHYRPARVIDAKGGVVHPGFIDCHYHAAIHLARGIVPDDPAAKIAFSYADWTNHLHDEDENIQAQIVALEMLRHGYTFFLEPGTIFAPDAVAAGIEAVGVRASLADPYLWDVADGGNSRPATTPRIPNDPERAFAVLGGELRRNRDPNALVRGHVGIYGGGSQSERLMRAAKQCADANGVVFTMHHNFTLDQTHRDDSRFGGGHSMVAFGARGLLGPNCLFVHMNIIRDDEVAPIVESGMSLLWQPGNYMYYGIHQHWPSRMAEIIARGGHVVFGVDTAKIWTFGDLELIGYLVARQNGAYVSTYKLMEMRTVDAARAVGLSDMIGSLEPGKRADIVVRQAAAPESAPGVNPVQELLLGGHRGTCAAVLVDGRMVLRDGRATLVDQDATVMAAREAVRRVLQRAGFVPGLAWTVVA
jgi:cytosine/adenosine deaminase-related metal-dependent hydrolase